MRQTSGLLELPRQQDRPLATPLGLIERAANPHCQGLEGEAADARIVPPVNTGVTTMPLDVVDRETGSHVFQRLRKATGPKERRLERVVSL